MDPLWMQYTDPTSIARDLTLEASQAASKLFKSNSSSRNLSSTKLKALLDSRNDKEILEGLRRVISVGSVRTSLRHDLMLVVDDISRQTMLDVLLIGRQKCRKFEHRNQEASIHVPATVCGS